MMCGVLLSAGIGTDNQGSAQIMTLSATLLISCPDRQGLVAAVTNFLSRNNGNILQLDQHVDTAESVFFMRVQWDMGGFRIARGDLQAAFQAVADTLEMDFSLHFSDQIPRMAVFVSKEAHCLYDILYRYQSGEWPVTIPVIISNHPDLGPLAEKFGIDFHVTTVTKDTKPQAELEQLNLLKRYEIECVILARYMQIISADFIGHYPNHIINIHHSFLPAFVGAKPYHRAHERGVKIIGATAHFVTADLDEGPIIHQDVERITHADSPEDLVRKGRDIERRVLAEAVRLFAQERVLMNAGRTVVFRG
jgi:formyltetrahydrofolate deformylase